jgi:uncharacterized SAM-binding protein YcdF (DUF218 family)
MSVTGWLLAPLALLALLTVLALPWTSAHLLRILEAAPPLADPSGLREAQAIVVMGSDYAGYAPEFGGDTVGPLTLQRLHYAAHLHRQTRLPLLVTGGQIGRGGRSLAACMAEVLQRDFQTPPRWIEHRARNTSENARFSIEMLRSEGIDRVCIVTHGFHMHRALRWFTHGGFRAVAAPTMCRLPPTPLAGDFVPNGASLYRSTMAVREWLSRLLDVWRKLSPGAPAAPPDR